MVNTGKCQNTIYFVPTATMTPFIPPPPYTPTHSLELPFSRVCVVTVVKICKRCEDLLEDQTNTRGMRTKYNRIQISLKMKCQLNTQQAIGGAQLKDNTFKNLGIATF